jgi:hypothetical protein
MPEDASLACHYCFSLLSGTANGAKDLRALQAVGALRDSGLMQKSSASVKVRRGLPHASNIRAKRDALPTILFTTARIVKLYFQNSLREA